MAKLLETTVTPDWKALRDCVLRKGTPARAHHIELFLDWEIQEAVIRRFGLREGLDEGDPFFHQKRQLRVQRFLGYDFVRQGIEGMEMELRRSTTEDTAATKKEGGRTFIDSEKGPVTTWEEFERYQWPDPKKFTTKALEWHEKNLPDDMCVIGSGGFGHFAEHLTWLMGYETLCYTLYDDRKLVQAICDRLLELNTAAARLILQFNRVKIAWGSDDMGHKTGTLISPDDLREFVMPGHKKMAEMAHAAGRPYLLHACGNLNAIYEDLIEDVKIDAKHSYEDTIEDVRDVKKQYGDRMSILGGIDVDFLCRAGEDQIRKRVRETLEVCQPGGGYCLGTGNSVANYIPLENYLVMLDEGRRFQLE